MKSPTMIFAFLLAGSFLSIASATVPPVPITKQADIEATQGLDISVGIGNGVARLVTLDAEPKLGERLRHVRLQIIKDDKTVFDAPLMTESTDKGYRVTFAIDSDLAQDAVVVVSFGTKERAQRRYRIRLRAFIPNR